MCYHRVLQSVCQVVNTAGGRNLICIDIITLLRLLFEETRELYVLSSVVDPYSAMIHIAEINS